MPEVVPCCLGLNSSPKAFPFHQSTYYTALYIPNTWEINSFSYKSSGGDRRFWPRQKVSQFRPNLPTSQHFLLTHTRPLLQHIKSLVLISGPVLHIPAGAQFLMTHDLIQRHFHRSSSTHISLYMRPAVPHPFWLCGNLSSHQRMQLVTAYVKWEGQVHVATVTISHVHTRPTYFIMNRSCIARHYVLL